MDMDLEIVNKNVCKWENDCRKIKDEMEELLK